MLASVKSAVRRLAAPAAGSVRAAASRASFSPANAAKVRVRAFVRRLVLLPFSLFAVRPRLCGRRGEGRGEKTWAVNQGV